MVIDFLLQNHREPSDDVSSSTKKSRKHHSSSPAYRHKDSGLPFDRKTFEPSNQTPRSSPAAFRDYYRQPRHVIAQDGEDNHHPSLASTTDIYGASSTAGTTAKNNHTGAPINTTRKAGLQTSQRTDDDDNSGSDMDIYGGEDAKDSDTKVTCKCEVSVYYSSS